MAERLENAGAVLIAKLATNPFAGGGEPWFRGLTRCPWNPRLGAAGSSSGSGSATAAGLVGFSIATDTAGSIIDPSMRCGTVGIRPTFGRVSRHGCMQLCWSLDTIGPICRTADDCGLVLSAIHGADPRDPTSVDHPYVWPSSRDLSTIRVGYARHEKDGDDREELRVLRELGVQLVPIPSPKPLEDYGLTFELIEGIVAIESAASFDELVRHGGPKGVHRLAAVLGLRSSAVGRRLSEAQSNAGHHDAAPRRLDGDHRCLSRKRTASVHEPRGASDRGVSAKVRERRRVPHAAAHRC